MKIQKFTCLCLTTLSLALLASTAHANLVTNGAFEQYSPGVFGNGFQTVNVGSNAIVGWTVGGSSVDIIHGAYGAVSGNSIDMLGSPGPGSLSQTINTVIGQVYLLEFDMSSNRGGDNTAAGKELNVIGLGGGATHSFSALAAGISHQSFSFTADASSTFLTFSSGPSGYSGSVLDNVSVTAVPEPQTFALMLVGLGLIGAVARRRNAKRL